MEALPITHIMLVAVWLGFVLVETILEVFGPRWAGHTAVARLHFWIDMSLEGPVVLGVLVTGVMLLPRMMPLSGIFQVKIIAGLAAIAVNIYCLILVVQRYLYREDAAMVAILSRRILWCWLGVPFGLAALVVGLGHLMGKY